MKLDLPGLEQLGQRLAQERRRQKLTREEAASICGVSVSFIRDAESNPESCSFGKLVRLIAGLGLTLEVQGLDEGTVQSKAGHLLDVIRTGLHKRSENTGKLDFGPSPSQIIQTRSSLQSTIASQGLTQKEKVNFLPTTLASQVFAEKDKLSLLKSTVAAQVLAQTGVKPSGSRSKPNSGIGIFPPQRKKKT